MMKPDVTIKLTGTDCLYPLWKVESPIPEQQTMNRITEHCRDAIKEFIQIEQKKDWNKLDSINTVLVKQHMDILPSLPVDAASLNEAAEEHERLPIHGRVEESGEVFRCPSTKRV